MLTIRILLRSPLGGLAGGRPGPQGGDRMVQRTLAGTTTIRDAIEALGVPHCEMGPIGRTRFLGSAGPGVPVGGRARRRENPDPEEPVRDGDFLSVSPRGPRILAEPRLLCDAHLGKLGRLLRILGFDTAWNRDWTEAEIVRRGLNEERAVLSRSRGLLKRREMDLAQLIRSDDPDEQVAEVLVRWTLVRRVRLFGRCSRCNGLLAAVPKARVADRIPPKTALWLDEYFLCGDCGQLFWKGTHVQVLTRRLEGILARLERQDRGGPGTGPA